MAADCIFCRIVRGEIPARLLFSDDSLVAFHDVAPQAPVHVLLVPRRHVPSLAASGADEPALLGALVARAARLAAELGLAGGYRLVVNCGEDGGQSVGHLHLHLLGGRAMGWPPG
jgi:histidine triad (HIT) family protein